MPELPEVETVRRSLLACARGWRVRGARVFRAEVIEGDRSARALLEGATIAGVERRGKSLAIVAEDGRALGAHLGMTGRLCVTAAGSTRDKHTHVEWEIERAGATRGERRVLRFVDPRRFGGLWTFARIAELREALWGDLGPDALGITPDALGARLCGTKRVMKAALLDQRVLAGLGNIYVDESLHGAGLSPLLRADRLRPAQVEALAREINGVLERAIEAGGSTLRDGQYVNALAEAGEFQRRHAVYGRAGQACLRCERTLRSAVVAGRTTVWCGGCQPRRRKTGVKS